MHVHLNFNGNGGGIHIPLSRERGHRIFPGLEDERYTMIRPATKVQFDPDQLYTVNQAVDAAEELVCNFYKLSVTQIRQLNYDIKTAAQLVDHEIIEPHFAQIIRYRTRKIDSLLESDADDFYKVCLQDHSILSALKEFEFLRLYPFMLYIVCHELIHVVRFRRFLQHFHAPPDHRQKEEIRVHHLTHEVLGKIRISDLEPVFEFFRQWQQAFNETEEMSTKPLLSG